MYKGQGSKEAGRLLPHAVQKARADNHVPSPSANRRSSNANKSPQVTGNKQVCPNVKEALRKKLAVGRGDANHVHPTPAKPKIIFPCKKCRHKSTNATSARLHARTHLTSAELKKASIFYDKCPHCEKTFYRRDNFSVHLAAHDGRTNHACPHCEKKFIWKAQLTRHLHVHVHLSREEREERAATPSTPNARPSQM